MKKNTLLLTVCFLASCLISKPNLNAQTPPIVPAWALKHIVWEDNVNTREGAERLVNLYHEHAIPVEAIIIDSPWSTAYNDFKWDDQRYPGHKDMIEGFAKNDVRVILWLTGAINTQSKDTREDKCEQYDYAVSKNYGINNSEPHNWWKGFGIHIDFTIPEAVQWWNSELDKVFTDNVYGWKVDQAEYWFGDIINTSKGPMGNADFRPWYYDSMYDYTVSRKADGITIARPYSHQGGFAASPSKLSIGWCGDFTGDWKGLKLQINNIYRSSQAGYGAVACEVGGFFRQASNREQFVRYAQFGAMCSTMINGGENGAFKNHLPWYHGEDVADIYRDCVNLHNSLVPYIFSTLVDVHQRGGSLIRSMSYEQESHMFGPAIFTKAITSEDNSPAFTLPSEGEWIDWWTGEKHLAGAQIEKEYALDVFPLFVKAGSIIPMEEDGKLVFKVYPSGADLHQVFHLPTSEGVDYVDVRVDYKHKKSKLVVEGLSKDQYRVEIVK